MYATVVASALAISATLFSSASAQFTNQSAPFELIVLSATNATLNGSSLYACHQGAALEGLCNAGHMTMVNTDASTFTLNSSAYDDGTQGSGYLTWFLEATSFNVSEPMSLIFDASTNVALPLFQPTESGQIVAFDDKDYLNIRSYVVDTTTPPTTGNATAYYRWYVCISDYTGYTYETLNWVFGEYPPQNPSCQKVDILRVF